LRGCRGCLDMLVLVIPGIVVDKQRLISAFSPEVFATDRALELVADGMPFRDAYDEVKLKLDALKTMNPVEAVEKKVHAGASAGLDFPAFAAGIRAGRKTCRSRLQAFDRAISKLLRVPYPSLG